jgi:hypothetical protein
MISDELWNRYVDTGKVSVEILDHVAHRIYLGKRMSIREKQIYSTYSQEIEERLRTYKSSAE